MNESSKYYQHHNNISYNERCKGYSIRLFLWVVYYNVLRFATVCTYLHDALQASKTLTFNIGYCYFAKETIQSRKNQVGSCHKDNRLASPRFSEQCTTAFFNLYQNNCFCKTKAPRNNTQKVNIRVEWSKSTQIHWIDPLVKGQKDDDR